MDSEATNELGNLLWEAAKEGDNKAVALLLRNPRVDPSYCNGFALLSAINHENIEVVKILLQDGRVLNTMRTKLSLLLDLVKIGAKECCEILLQKMDRSYIPWDIILLKAETADTLAMASDLKKLYEAETVKRKREK